MYLRGIKSWIAAKLLLNNCVRMEARQKQMTTWVIKPHKPPHTNNFLRFSAYAFPSICSNKHYTIPVNGFSLNVKIFMVNLFICFNLLQLSFIIQLSFVLHTKTTSNIEVLVKVTFSFMTFKLNFSEPKNLHLHKILCNIYKLSFTIYDIVTSQF